jgi:hypothetical protein
MKNAGMSPQRARRTLAAKRKRAARKPWIFAAIFLLLCALIGSVLASRPHIQIAIASRDIAAGEKVTTANSLSAEVTSQLTILPSTSAEISSTTSNATTPLSPKFATLSQARGKRAVTRIPRGSAFPLWSLQPDRHVQTGQTVVTIKLSTSPDILHVGQTVALLTPQDSTDAKPHSAEGLPIDSLEATIWSLAPPSSSASEATGERYDSSLIQVCIQADEAHRLISHPPEEGYIAVAQ